MVFLTPFLSGNMISWLRVLRKLHGDVPSPPFIICSEKCTNKAKDEKIEATKRGAAGRKESKEEGCGAAERTNIREGRRRVLEEQARMRKKREGGR